MNNTLTEKNIQQDLFQRNRRMALINRIGRMVSSSLEFDRVLETALREIRGLLDVFGISFWLKAPGTDELVCIQAKGPGSEVLINWRLAIGQGITGWVAKHGKSVLVPDTLADERHYENIDQIVETPVRSLLGIPLLAKGKVIGILVLVDPMVNRFTPDDLEFVESIGATVSIAIENARLFKEIHEAKDAAEAASRAKSEFLANMSHEIRTPMNAILGFSELLLNAIDEPQQKSWIDGIYSSGRVLLSLINDILDLSKIEAGKLDIRPEPINLKEIINEINKMFSHECRRKGLLLKTEIGPDVPKGLLLDEIRIRQILINLVGNAIKFTSEGYVKIKVISPQNKSGEKTGIPVVFEIEDTGIGIPEDQYKLIFENFSQQEGQSARKYGGTGLGLAITKRLTELMNGEIIVQSRVGKGSIFKIIFPDVIIARLIKKSGNAFESKDDEIIFQPADILLADRSVANRDVVKGYLQDLPFSVTDMENGEQVLEFLNKNRENKANLPDLILTGIRMKGINGWNMAEKVKNDKDFKDIPMIMLTASAMENTMHGIKGDFDGFLIKPFRKKELINELKKHLNYSIKNSTAQKIDEIDKTNKSLPKKNTAQLFELIEIMEKDLYPIWEETRDTLIFDEVESFAQNAGNKGRIFKWDPLVNWSKDIISYMQNFELDSLSVYFNKYPEIIEELKQFIKKPN